MSIKLEQTAVIISTTQSEHDESVAQIEADYGAGKANEGKISYVVNDAAKTVTLTKTIENYKVHEVPL